MDDDDIRKLLGTHSRDQGLEAAKETADQVVAFYRRCRESLGNEPGAKAVALTLTTTWITALISAISKGPQS